MVKSALWLRDFLRFVGERFIVDRCLQVAAALAYTTLLSLVPLMAVTFSILAAFPVFESMGQEIQDFAFSNFVPAAGEVVQSHLQGFAQKASRLTTVGVVVLMLTALMMMATIDKALNAIWRSQGRRTGISRFMVYWAVLTLGPVLVGMGLVATSYLTSLPLFSDSAAGVGGLKTEFLRWLPLLTTGLAFTLLYMVVPSRSVPLWPAILGGVFAALLFETAKRGFAWYVTHFPSYEAIYGALASIPIFLVWIYLSWLIILLGAEVAHSIVVFKDTVTVGRISRGELKFVLAVRLVGHLWRCQRTGEACSEEQLLALEPRFDEDTMGMVLEDLEMDRFVHRTVSGQWALARDAGELTVLQLYRAVPGPLPHVEERENESDPWSRSLDGVLVRVSRELEEVMDMSLKELFLDEYPQHPEKAPFTREKNGSEVERSLEPSIAERNRDPN
ncbi:MAG: virulence factor BrkB family protein [Gammaproteobacteria bacterium]|nr:virulence factor BrkB family protein [Gammaproteobacteria bacterium]